MRIFDKFLKWLSLPSARWQKIEKYWVERRRITGISVTFDDGTISTLSGPDADEWAKLNYYVLCGSNCAKRQLRDRKWNWEVQSHND